MSSGYRTGRPTGRPSKFTPETRNNLLVLLRLGTPFNLACKAVGINYTTFKTWRAKGRDDLEAGLQTEYATFYEETLKAEGQSAAALLQKIRKAAEDPRNWTAAAWILERRYPHLFGRNDRGPDPDDEDDDPVEDGADADAVALAMELEPVPAENGPTGDPEP